MLTIQCDAPQLYDQANQKDLFWPAEAQYEHDYIAPFLTSSSPDYVSNVQTRMLVLKNPDHIFPLTINDNEYENAYICSPYSKYITYAKQELTVLHNSMLRSILSTSLDFLGILLKTGKVNQVVCVNNWLLSTNLYPNMDRISLDNITRLLVASFPNHTIMFPSLNRHTNASLMDRLQKLDYIFVPSREVFIFDKTLKDYEDRRITQTDFDLLKKTSYRIVSHKEITEKDFDRIVELYTILYINKYSDCNPKFTAKFIALCHQKNLFNFQGLRGPGGELVGIIASFSRNGVLATPLIGYNTDLPLKDGLYRMLTALAMKEATQKGLIFNMSAGVSEFKKWRGGVGFIEYSAVYCKHLPINRRQVWNFLNLTMTGIGVPLLHKYKF